MIPSLIKSNESAIMDINSSTPKFDINDSPVIGIIA